MDLPAVHSSSTTASTALRRLRRPALVCAGALVAALGVNSPAAAHQVNVGDTYEIPIPEVAEKTVDLVYTCDTSTGEPTDCTPKQQTTPGTKAVLLKLVWSFSGAADGVAATLENPLPGACGGKRGVNLVIASTGGTGTASLFASIQEQNNLTGDTTEQVLVNESKLIGSSGAALGRAICFP